MTILVQWYGRRQDDFSTIWSEEHHGSISGENASDCMKQLQNIRNNHDCALYTPIEIIYVFD